MSVIPITGWFHILQNKRSFLRPSIGNILLHIHGDNWWFDAGILDFLRYKLTKAICYDFILSCHVNVNSMFLPSPSQETLAFVHWLSIDIIKVFWNCIRRQFLERESAYPLTWICICTQLQNVILINQIRNKSNSKIKK